MTRKGSVATADVKIESLVRSPAAGTVYAYGFTVLPTYLSTGAVIRTTGQVAIACVTDERPLQSIATTL